MKKFGIALLALWIMACTIVFFPKSPSGTPRTIFEITLESARHASPSMMPGGTMTPFTPVPTAGSPTPTSMPPSPTEAPVLAATLIIPTLQTGSSVRLLSMQMIDAQTGWGIQAEAEESLRTRSWILPWPPDGYGDYEGYILRTGDGGKTWQNVTPPTGAYSPGGFFALDANTAWASGNIPGGGPNRMATSVWRTTDGGQTWQASQPFVIAEIKNDLFVPTRMQFIDQTTGWLLAGTELSMNGYYLGETLFRTTDGGNNWEKVNSFLEDVGGCGNGGLVFINSATGWYGASCVGDGKTSLFFDIQFTKDHFNVKHTTDGGDSFSFEATIPMPPDLRKLEATKPDMSCGTRRVIAFTPDVIGIEWECEPFGHREQYSNYLSLSVDAGRTWHTWKPTGNEVFINATHGWRLLSPGQLQQTTDGGRSWVNLKTVAWEAAHFDFISEQEGWALVTQADATAFVHTTDGSKTWEEIKPVIASP